VWDTDKPDGTPRKLLDTGRMSSEGWNNHIGLDEGIEHTYSWFIKNFKNIREVSMS